MIQKLVRFGMIGAGTTLAYYLVSIALVDYVSVFLAGLAGFAVAVSASYLGHFHVTFRIADGTAINRQRISRFAVTALLGLIATQATLYVASTLLKLPAWLALGAVVAVVPPLTFLLCQFWVFRDEEVEGRTNLKDFAG